MKNLVNKFVTKPNIVPKADKCSITPREYKICRSLDITQYTMAGSEQVKFSPDGTRVATTSADGRLTVWNTTGKSRRQGGGVTGLRAALIHLNLEVMSYHCCGAATFLVRSGSPRFRSRLLPNWVGFRLKRAAPTSAPNTKICPFVYY